MRLTLICLLLCIPAVTAAQSATPNKPAAHKMAPPKDERGTEKQPFVIKGFPTKPTQEEQQQDQRYREDQVSLTHSVAHSLSGMHNDGTLVMWLTIGLLLVAIGQFEMFRRQLRAMRDEFSASHPPKLAARAFRLRQRTHDRPPGVEFLISNDGGSSAVITLDVVANDIRMAEDMASLEEGSFPDLSRASQNIIEHREYIPSKRLAHFIALKGMYGDEVLDANLQKVLDGTAGFVFAGIVRYQDRARVVYELRFFRRFVPGKKYLKPHPNPDYDSAGDPDYEKENTKPTDRFAWRKRRHAA